MPALTPPTITTQAKTEKLFYIDNIRILLTILVILHHACVCYGAPGGWYYKEQTATVGALIPMTMFVSLNQSFFMGFFFLLSGFFTYSSYHRKGALRFFTDRLVRLGIPLIFYSFIFSPVLSYLVYYFAEGSPISLWQYLSGYNNWIEFGVLWFVAALLLFTLAYIFGRKLFIPFTKAPLPTPGTKGIFLFSIAIGVISFLIRIKLPVGWVLRPVGFQPGHFSQYIALFIIGLLASKNNWLHQLSFKTGQKMLRVALYALWFFPVFFIIRTKLNMPIAWYSGGFHWQALLYAVWEQCIGFAIITAILTYGKRYWNTSSYILNILSRKAFAVYILHPLPLIGLSLILRNWAVDPAIKLLVVAPLGVAGSFLLAWAVLLVPAVKRII
ncbi:acyltransferase family protein [Mucilaginibacter litoreus]|uniref:Acyltransferase family protein n=1 Tax=Mucilaginibacter litoreus TaxID=1048221 RepID=A0ABW3AWX8_9SPHI